MASKIIGRAACPWCDFDAAHVRESDKCLYLYCPDCGISTHFRTDRQRDLLRAKGIRTEGQQAAAPAIEPHPVTAATEQPPPQPPATNAPIEPAAPASVPAKPKRAPKPKAPPPPADLPPVSLPPAPPKPRPAPQSWWGAA